MLRNISTSVCTAGKSLYHSSRNLFTQSSVIQTHFSPGISNRLVSPVQLMSSFCVTREKEGKHVGLRWQCKIKLKHNLMCETATTLTGLRMKNIVIAPTRGTSPIRGSRITRSFPCSYKEKNAKMLTVHHTKNHRAKNNSTFILIPGFLSLQLCKSTSWFPHWSQHHQHNWKYKKIQIQKCMFKFKSSSSNEPWWSCCLYEVKQTKTLCKALPEVQIQHHLSLIMFCVSLYTNHL